MVHALNRGTPQVGISLLPYPDRGKGVSPSWWTSQKPLVWEFEYTCPTLKVTTELQELITYVSYLYIRWKLEGFNFAHYRNCAPKSPDCAPVPRDLQIAHWCHAIPRLHKPSAQSRDWLAISGFWECAAQSRVCTNSHISRNRDKSGCRLTDGAGRWEICDAAARHADKQARY